MLLSEISKSYDRKVLAKSCSLPDLGPLVKAGLRPRLVKASVQAARPGSRQTANAVLEFGDTEGKPAVPVDLGSHGASSTSRASRDGLSAKKTHVLARQELFDLGLQGTGHRLYRQAQAGISEKALLRAESAGGIGALRASLRSARVQMGLEDPLVKRIGLLLSDAEHTMRLCRKKLAEGDLHKIPSIMREISIILSRVEFSGLGPRLWTDPWLAWAREKRDAWTYHQKVVLDFIDEAGKGTEGYCAKWAALIDAEEAVVSSLFGDAITKELLQLPDAGKLLAAALAKVADTTAAPMTLSKACDKAASLTRGVCKMLSCLSSKELDALLLGKAIGPDENSALRTAAAQFNLSIFLAFHHIFSGECILITSDLEQRLIQEANCDRLRPPIERAAVQLGTLLNVDPAELCLWRLPRGGLRLRLLVTAGQPAAERAREILGLGASLDMLNQSQEAKHMREVGRITEQFFVLQRARRDLEVDLACARDTADVLRAAFSAAEKVAERLGKEAALVAARLGIARAAASTAWSVYCATKDECTETIIENADDEAAIQVVEQKLAVKEEAMMASKQIVQDVEKELAEARARHSAASGEASKSRDKFDQAEHERNGIARNLAKTLTIDEEALRRQLAALGFAVGQQPWVRAGEESKVYWWRAKPTGDAEKRSSEPDTNEDSSDAAELFASDLQLNEFLEIVRQRV